MSDCKHEQFEVKAAANRLTKSDSPNAVPYAFKAICLWQPHASFMRAGLKTIETRGRLTHYRGDLVICSARHRYPTSLPWSRHVPKLGVALGDLPLGFALCVVEVYGCLPVERITAKDSKFATDAVELDLGDYTSGKGRFAWLTRNLRPLAWFVPVVGHQGFFNLQPPASTQVAEALAKAKVTV